MSKFYFLFCELSDRALYFVGVTLKGRSGFPNCLFHPGKISFLGGMK